MRFQIGVEMIKHHTGFDADGAFLRIKIDNVSKVFAVVDNQRHAGGLPALACAAAAREHRHLGVARHVDGVLDVVCRFGNECADWNLLVDRCVGRVTGAVCVGEKDFALGVFT